MAKLTKREQQQYDKCLAQCSGCMLNADCMLRRKIRELRVLSDAEKLSIAFDFLDFGGLSDYQAECERREKEHDLTCPHHPEIIRDGQMGECTCNKGGDDGKTD